MKFKIILTFLLISVNIHTSDLEIIVGLYTQHNIIVKYYEYNNINNLILLKYKNLIGGYMKNSYYKDSFMFGFNKDINKKLSVIIMLASGYEQYHQSSKADNLYYEDKQVIGNNYKLLFLINYKLSKNIIISTNGLITTTCFTFRI